MQIKELDPKKRYFVILEDEYLTANDVNAVSAKLKALNVDAVVLAGASVRGGETYFGLYCEQCGTWWVEPDARRLVFYPAPELANAHLNDSGWFRSGPVHPWKVQEFGKEDYVARENLKQDAEICPVLRQTLANEQARKNVGAW